MTPAIGAAASPHARGPDPLTGLPLAPRADETTYDQWDPSREQLDEAALLEDLMARLRDSPTASALVAELEADQVRVELLPRADFLRRNGHVGASYNMNTRTITLVRENAIERPTATALSLAHEAQHYVDDRDDGFVGGRIRAVLGALAGGLLVDPLRLRNPVRASLDRLSSTTTIEPEVRAFTTEGLVSQELGVRKHGSRALHDDGSLRDPDELRELLRWTPGYRMSSAERLALGVPLAALAAGAPAMGADFLLERAGRAHLRPRLAIGAAAAAVGMLAHDLRRHTDWPADPDPEGTAAALAAALEVLRSSPTGAAILGDLEAGNVPIRVLGSNEFSSRFRGADAIYRPAQQEILLPRRVLDDPLRAAVIIGHEGVHHQDRSGHIHGYGGPGSFLGGLARGAAQGIARGTNPVTAALDGSWEASIETEVNAYEAENVIVAELGQGRASHHARHPDGTPRSREEIRESVAASAGYALDGAQRAVFGTAVAGSLTLPPAWGVAELVHWRTGRAVLGRALAGAAVASAALVAHDLSRDRSRSTPPGAGR